jgi:hypothetical protein
VEKNYNTYTGQQSVKKIHAAKQFNMENILSEFSDIYEGLGKLQLQLHINKDIKPIALPKCKILFKMQRQVREKLKQLLDSDVIDKVECAHHGCHPW